jgi:hypothetical protein
MRRRRQSSRSATRFGTVLRAVTVIRIGLFLAFSYSVPGWAETILDADKIMPTAPKVAAPAHLLLLQGEQNIHHVRVDNRRTLPEARKGIGSVSNLTARLAVVIESKPMAYAIPLAGRNMILVSTGLLELVGPDSSMAAALLGSANAHPYRKRPLKIVSHLPSLVYDAVAIGSNIGRQTGNRRAAADAARPGGLIGAFFTREQEMDAKKFFPDPIMGIRGDAAVLEVPVSS